MAAPERDEEKQAPKAPNASLDNQFLVEWDSDNDPLNPRNFHPARKWLIVTIVSLTSCLITSASSIYTPAYDQIMEEFNCSEEVAILGLSMMVLGLALGALIFAPLSEFYGRKPIYIVSTAFFLIWLIPCAVAQNTQTLLVARFLNGFAGSAFLSVASGTVSDMFIQSEIQAPMMLYTLSPFVGPELGPIVGGFIDEFTTWRWIFYVLLIWTGVLLIAMIFLVPETYHPVLLARKAAAKRKATGNTEYHSASEIALAKKSLSGAILSFLSTPFKLLMFDLMCLSLCVYSAFLLGVLYLFFGAFPLVFTQTHGFNKWQSGLSFLGLLVGCFIADATNPLWARNYRRLVQNAKAKNEASGKSSAPQRPAPELRLPPTIAASILVPVSIFWFGWTSYSSIHWIVPIIGSVFFGIGLLLAYAGVFTFLVDAYPSYAASALAANVFVRCIFAAAFPLFGQQMYNKLGIQWATSLLGFLALAMLPFPLLFFRYGHILRAKSKFATSFSQETK